MGCYVTSIDKSGPDESGDTIDDDWLNAFETEARLKSTEEVQAFFGKVLAWEIRKPGSYSTRAIKILGSLDQNIANQFARLGSMRISQFDRPIVRLIRWYRWRKCASGMWTELCLRLDLLNGYGLVISDYDSWWEATPCVGRLRAQHSRQYVYHLSYLGKGWAMEPKSKSSVSIASKSIWSRGYSIWPSTV